MIEQLGSDSCDNFGTVTTNSVVAAGRIDNKDPRVVKFDAMGALVWKRNPRPAKAEQANGVAIDGAGNVIVSITTSYPIDTWVTKYDSAGPFLWKKRFDSGSNGFAYRVAVDSAGNIYTAGSTGPLASSTRDTVLVKYSPSGTRREPPGLHSCGPVLNAAGAHAMLAHRAGGALDGIWLECRTDGQRRTQVRQHRRFGS